MSVSTTDHDYWLARGDDNGEPEEEEGLDLDHDLEPIAPIPTVDQWEEQEEAHEMLIENILAGEIAQ
jgi:hypothetical protein